MKILMVLTSHDKLGNTGRETGFWLEEFAAPYFTFKDAGAEIVSPAAVEQKRAVVICACDRNRSFTAWLRCLASPGFGCASLLIP